MKLNINKGTRDDRERVSGNRCVGCREVTSLVREEEISILNAGFGKQAIDVEGEWKAH